MDIKIIKRSGEVVGFDTERIRKAVTKAITATGDAVEPEKIDGIVDQITTEIEERFVDFHPNVENVQDVVEKHLVKAGLYEVAKAYILYRAKRQDVREQQKKELVEKSLLGKLTVKKRDGKTVMFDIAKVRQTILRHRTGFEDAVNDESVDLVIKEVVKNLYDGVTTLEIENAIVLATTAFIERDPAFGNVAARIFRQLHYKEAMGVSLKDGQLDESYRKAFKDGITKGIEAGVLHERMKEFDLDKIAPLLKPERDELLLYMGTKTLYERYYMSVDEVRVELPQSFWMRVAMGLSMDEENKYERIAQFYEIMSTLRYIPSTPTLFHSGLHHPQLSSCYLTTIDDNLAHIFKCMGDNAQLSKWSGGIGNDWTNIRATGARIQSTNVDSQGAIPFLKIANDVTAAINRSGKRRGATCAYMETWHMDVQDFLDLRRNTGDERRRTHDMNTANWIPDLFMKRVMNDEDWTLFSPDEAPELHHIYGRAFEKKYEEYEEKARNGKMQKYRVVRAKKLWKKMLSRLFETGHPWMTWKDACNIRSPQDHAGVVHSSNLCTEITLNTSPEETAVCNLGSINLAMHVTPEGIEKQKLQETVHIAMRMLDNVIDLNFYPTQEAKNSNMKHRPVGLGVMGLQDALYVLNIPFESDLALSFVDTSQEFISYHAIFASSQLAKERGAYPSYEGSKWSRNLFPLDTLRMLEEERGVPIDIPKVETLDWTQVRAHVKEHGMRNSNTMAVAPTATIATIAGSFPSIEPIYKNIYVKANVSGEFTVVNHFLIQELKAMGQWNQEMLDQLKYYDGSVQLIAGLPDTLKKKYKEAFEIDTLWAHRMTAVRGKWIDQSQSYNVFMSTTSGKQLSDCYLEAWKLGLKTTYYLRSMGKSQVEKSTLDASKFGFTQKREYKEMEGAAATIAAAVDGTTQTIPETPEQPQQPTMEQIKQEVKQVKLCKLEDPDCEACQ